MAAKESYFNMLRILITGGAGFIGKHVISQLRESYKSEGVEICVVDSLYQRVHNLETQKAAELLAVDLRIADVTDSPGLSQIVRAFKPDVIVHLAAETSTGDSAVRPTLHTHTNASGTAALLESLIFSKHVPRKIVLSSSRAVYGEGLWVDPFEGATMSNPL